MKKYLSILLTASVLLSITGYTIPCTLHCLHSHSDMFHKHNDGETSHTHHHDEETECKGSCSMEKMMTRSSNQQQDSLPNAMNLSQYLSKLLVGHLIKEFVFYSQDSRQLLNTGYISTYQSWIPEPVIPPPQFLPSIS